MLARALPCNAMTAIQTNRASKLMLENIVLLKGTLDARTGVRQTVGRRGMQSEKGESRIASIPWGRFQSDKRGSSPDEDDTEHHTDQQPEFTKRFWHFPQNGHQPPETADSEKDRPCGNFIT